MLKKRFPELNLGFTDTSNLNGFLEQPATSPDEPYNYEEFFMGSVNNNVRSFIMLETNFVRHCKLNWSKVLMSRCALQQLVPASLKFGYSPSPTPRTASFPALKQSKLFINQPRVTLSSMNEFYTNDKEKSVLTNYLQMGDFAVCLHHAPDETSGQEVPGWYRVQVRFFKFYLDNHHDQVIQYPDDYNVVIMYVDFGSYATVPLEMVRKLM